MQATETILAQAAQYATRHTCSAQCPDGQPCCLDGEAPHALHVCCDSCCLCHSERRYRVAHREHATNGEAPHAA